MSGLSDTGFESRTVEELLVDFETAQRSRVDPAINTSATGVLGNLNAVFALALSRAWEAAHAVYDAHDPAAASGVALDAIGALRGVPRRGATKSSVTLRVMLDAGATLAAGAVVSYSGDPLVRFVTQADVAAVDAGPYDVLALAEDAGPISAGASTLTTIESPSSGWNSVVNLTAATLGTGIETDAQYRLRQLTELSQAGSSTVAGIESAVRAVAGVDSVKVLENVLDVADADGMPPHSFEVVALFDGADDDTIGAAVARAIWLNKPVGIAPVGATGVTVTDDSGAERLVHFTRPALVPIGIRWHGTFDSTYDVGADASSSGIGKAIMKAVGDATHPGYFAVGADVYLARILDAAMDAQGVVNLTINIARDAAPGSAVPSAMDLVLEITPRELARLGPMAVSP